MTPLKKVLATLVIIQLLITGLLLTAQHNYNNAVKASINSEGTDLIIEQTMLNYGFNSAWYEAEPTATDKIKALFATTSSEYTMELMYPDLIKLYDNRDGSTIIISVNELEETINKREE